MPLIRFPRPAPIFVKATIESRLLIPFFGSVVQAVFPSPAENYVERACDLNDLCIVNQEATYFVRAVGDSMEGDHIREGDVLVVDCSRDAADGKIVVAWAELRSSESSTVKAGTLTVFLHTNRSRFPPTGSPSSSITGVGRWN